ncbi:two-component system, chemotaxis family, sensor kinase CheA [Halobacillus alkaliphilus]|uniref:Chemotaxis protein CheA n=1 Tax=Halobacillus alkaliphilus TaxID=396056 RepID=A0A1I2KWM4_9BACI|nr:chemotaxis protein CheA [Halobacillus alkaliphilus]SFF70758.1 two-component system, chemotaxis family, sensor kinase CheA [Halobacillus alkaliphilus]
MDNNPYLEVFIDESKEHLQAINDHLLLLEKDPEDLSIVNEIFRSAHTLKGMSATMGYQDLSNLTHQMENVLDGVRDGLIKVDADMLDIVFDSVDGLEAMVMDIADGGAGNRDVKRVVKMLEGIEVGERSTTFAFEPAQQTYPSMNLSIDEFTRTVLEQSKEQGQQNYRVEVTLRDDCLLKAARVYMVFEVLEQLGEVILSVPSVEQLENEEFEQSFIVLLITTSNMEEVERKIHKVSEIERVEVAEFLIDSRLPELSPLEEDDPSDPVNNIKSEEKIASVTSEKTNQRQVGNKTIRINIDRLDGLMNLFEELVIDKGRLEQISSELNHTELQETVEHMSRISGDLQSIILNMRMVPIEQVFNRFPRMVRQFSRDLNKQVNLNIVGADTELDRTVIDEIGDPLVHLIRNALDHGIESPAERERKGKESSGNLELKAFHRGNHVFIEIADDGAGINRDKVIRKAVSNHVVTEHQALKMNNKQVYELIMESGFSTADTVSDVSGRGVGLDVVKSTIEALGGTITVNSELDRGSIFSVQLPLTLSIISVMLVEVQKEKFAIPLGSIIETAIVKKEDVMLAHRKQVIEFRGKVVPLVFLEEVLEVPSSHEKDEYLSLVMVRKKDKMAGLVVDSFIGQQEVVLKSLSDYLSGAYAISGATILGDGQVALILDSDALIK